MKLNYILEIFPADLQFSAGISTAAIYIHISGMHH